MGHLFGHNRVRVPLNRALHDPISIGRLTGTKRRTRRRGRGERKFDKHPLTISADHPNTFFRSGIRSKKSPRSRDIHSRATSLKYISIFHALLPTHIRIPPLHVSRAGRRIELVPRDMRTRGEKFVSAFYRCICRCMDTFFFVMPRIFLVRGLS